MKLFSKILFLVAISGLTINTGCMSGEEKPVGPAAACDDGVDNDGDRLADADDPGCASPDDADETNVPPPTSGCTQNSQCLDMFDQTVDACEIVAGHGTCAHYPTTCFGARSQPPANAARVEVWSGFGLQQGVPAPKIYDGPPSQWANMPGEPGFRRFPPHGCSAKFTDSNGNPIVVLTRVEWYHGTLSLGQCRGTITTWDCLHVQAKASDPLKLLLEGLEPFYVGQ